MKVGVFNGFRYLVWLSLFLCCSDSQDNSSWVFFVMSDIHYARKATSLYQARMTKAVWNFTQIFDTSYPANMQNIILNKLPLYYQCPELAIKIHFVLGRLHHFITRIYISRKQLNHFQLFWSQRTGLIQAKQHDCIENQTDVYPNSITFRCVSTQVRNTQV